MLGGKFHIRQDYPNSNNSLAIYLSLVSGWILHPIPLLGVLNAAKTPSNECKFACNNYKKYGLRGESIVIV